MSSDQIEKKLNWPPVFSSIFVLLTASYFLFIWIFIVAEKNTPGSTMQANTALGLLLGSIAVYLLRRKQQGNRLWRRRVGHFTAAIVFLIGLLTLSQYLLGINLGIDDLLVSASSNESTMYPGRMSPNSAICFILLGAGLLFIDKPYKRFHPASIIFIPMLLISLFALVGYVYGEKTFYKFGPYIRIAWQTAICFVALGLGALFSRPNNGPIRVLSDNGLAGMTARRLLPIIILLPVGLGWVQLVAFQQGYLAFEFGMAAHTLIQIITLLVVLILLTTKLLRIDIQRQAHVEELLRTKDKLEVALRSRDEFISIASHELKTPISSLKLQAQMVKRNKKKGDPNVFAPDRIVRLLDQVERQVDSLARLVDYMLDASKIRIGKLTIKTEKMSLNEWVEEVIERLRPTFAEASTPISLTFNGPSIEGKWDRLRLDQVVSNLLTNALRYGEQRPVEVVLEKSKEHLALLSVRDHGRGIKEEYREKIFNKFERAVDSNISGLGLGLFITSQIVNLHGGKVWVQSEGLGKGSTFYVELPLE